MHMGLSEEIKTPLKAHRKNIERIDKRHKGERRFLTHENGGNPYSVYNGGNRVSVYKLPNSIYELKKQRDINKNDYTKLVAEFKRVEKVFIPRCVLKDSRGKKIQTVLGSSILALLKNKAVFIGDAVYEFKPKDEIVKFFSELGGSDVPYPVALGKENVYFMLDQQYISREHFSSDTDWKDSYRKFYNMKRDKNMIKKIKKMDGTKRYP